MQDEINRVMRIDVFIVHKAPFFILGHILQCTAPCNQIKILVRGLFFTALIYT